MSTGAQERAAAIAARLRLERPLDLHDYRDRSDPELLRPEPVEVKVEPAPPTPMAVVDRGRKVAISDEQLQPVEPFDCPRCGTIVEGAAFYGPCNPCRGELRSGSVVGEPSQVGGEARPASLGVEPLPVLRRTHRNHKQRATVYRRVTREVGELLVELPVGTDRVVMVGPRPGTTAAGDRAWFLGELPDGWSHHERGHYLGGNAPVGKYRDPSGRAVEVHRAASWFGEGATDLVEVEAAAVELAAVFASWGLPVLATPATAGRELLLRTLPERAGGWSTLAPDHQELIRSTSGQGRMELFDDGLGELEGLHEYDGRMMYAGLVRQLGAGPATLVEGPAPRDPHARGRYLVEVEVPRDWSGPGLLGVVDGGDGWRYPSAPGERFQTWADGCELLLCDRYGWSTSTVASLVLDHPKGDPLRGWADKVTSARATATHPLVAVALRRLVLFTIGTLHGRGHKVTRVVEPSEAGQIPDNDEATMIGNQIVWSTDSGQAWPAMAHPEWSSAIWARARARLLSGPKAVGALHLEPGSRLVAFRTDAIYVDRRQPLWEAADDGANGRMVYKGGRADRLPLPSSVHELLGSRTWKAGN